jgi:xanthine dehydrogenase accessory factor
MQDTLNALIDALERGEQLALITAVRSVGSTPRHSAARMAVFTDGQILGTIGGGSMEHQAVADARVALSENQSRLVEYSLIGRGKENLGMCGGTQEVFIDILDPTDQAATGLLLGIRAALTSGEPAVLATIVRAENSELALGTRQVIKWSSDTLGSLGDARLDRAVVEQARQVMMEHYPQRLAFDPGTGAVKRLMSTRRAAIEVFLDLYEPYPSLVIIGAGHIGVALAKQGRLLDWRVQVVDDRAEFLAPERFPHATETCLVAYNSETEELGPINVSITPSTAVVVATWGWDEPVLRQLAGASAFYVGLVASLRKATIIFEALRAQGIDADWLNNARVPVGLDVGAESPEEIALAIMAEILTVARGKSGRPLCEVRGNRVAALNIPMPKVAASADVARATNNYA